MSLYSILPWIIAQAEQAAAEPAPGGMGGAWRLLVAAGVIVGSFVVGALLARALRLPDFAVKIGVVVFALVGGLAICISGWPPKLGIDLSGGVVLVYEVDTEQMKPAWIPTAIAQLSKELNAPGESSVTVRSVGSDKIAIEAPPGFDPKTVDRAVEDIGASVDVTFENAGDPRTENGKSIFTYEAEQKQRPVAMSDLIAAVGRRINPGGVKELTIRQYGAEQLEVIIPEVDKQEVDQIKKRISTSGLLEFRIVANQNDDRDIIRAGENTPGNDVYIGGNLVGRWVKAGPNFAVGPEALAAFRETPARGREVLVRIDRFNVDGGNLDQASKGYDQGQNAVNFSFGATGAAFRTSDPTKPARRRHRLLSPLGHHSRQRDDFGAKNHQRDPRPRTDHRKLHRKRSRVPGRRAQRRQAAGHAPARTHQPAPDSAPNSEMTRFARAAWR